MAPTKVSSHANVRGQSKSCENDLSTSSVAKRTRTRTGPVVPGAHSIENSLANASPAKAEFSKLTTSRKRKITTHENSSLSSSNPRTVHEVLDAKPLATAKSAVQKKAKTSPDEVPGKRLKRFRERAPRSFLQKLHRAQTQRMIVVGRVRSGSDAALREDIDIVGSTGNIYRVTIGATTACTCPDHRKGNECKHKVYALHTVLKAPEHLQYQLAFLSPELQEIFAHAPPLPTEVPSSGDTDGHRKPVEGECPICYMDLDEEANEIVWCKAACGNNLHKTCLEQWAASQKGTAVRCVYCRTPWQTDVGDVQSIMQAVAVNEDGYVNVAEQFGMSRARDYTTYHQPWVRRQFGMGW